MTGSWECAVRPPIAYVAWSRTLEIPKATWLHSAHMLPLEMLTGCHASLRCPHCPETGYKANPASSEASKCRYQIKRKQEFERNVARTLWDTLVSRSSVKGQALKHRIRWPIYLVALLFDAKGSIAQPCVGVFFEQLRGGKQYTPWTGWLIVAWKSSIVQSRVFNANKPVRNSIHLRILYSG
jgi:hypothetical protein